MQKMICVCLVFFLPAGLVAARDIFVNNAAGNDRFTGAQPRIFADTTGPVQTLAKALRLARAGDRIVLADTGQPYRDSLSLVGGRLSGLLRQPLVIDGGGAVLDGSAPVPRDQWEFYRDNRFRFRPPRMGSSQLFLDDRPAVRVSVAAAADTPPKLEPRQWCAHEGYIYFGVELSKLPSDYRLSYASLPTGITLYHVQNVVIKDLTVQGFQTDGIDAQNSAEHVVLDQVICRNNGRNGITVGGASQVEIRSCKVSGNGASQLLTLPYCEVHLIKSELPGDSAPAWKDEGGRVYLGDRPIRGGLETIRKEERMQNVK